MATSSSSRIWRAGIWAHLAGGQVVLERACRRGLLKITAAPHAGEINRTDVEMSAKRLPGNDAEEPVRGVIRVAAEYALLIPIKWKQSR